MNNHTAFARPQMSEHRSNAIVVVGERPGHQCVPEQADTEFDILVINDVILNAMFA